MRLVTLIILTEGYGRRCLTWTLRSTPALSRFEGSYWQGTQYHRSLRFSLPASFIQKVDGLVRSIFVINLFRVYPSVPAKFSPMGWLAFLLRSQDVPGSNPGRIPDILTGYKNAEKIPQNRPRPYPSTYSSLFFKIILAYIVKNHYKLSKN
jgi:hypothetical protein